MSAIGGIVDWAGRVDSAALRPIIAAALGFTGDNGAAWYGGHAGLVRVALATTSEAVGETQPHRDAGSGSTIGFDGRIDNREELRALLGREAPPAEAPDCAIVLAAWQRLGAALLERLAGDYAFAIWEPTARRLTCTRSPVGWRPLLWTKTRDGLAFATEPAMLIRGLGLTPGIDEGTIGEHLAARFVNETGTFWKGIERLPPGYLLEADVRGIRTRRWLEGPFEDSSRLSERDHIDRFTELFDQALVATARSTGTISAHLSGGLDSSSVVCRSHHLVSAGRLPTMPHALSMRFPGEECDEGAWIEAVEAHCGIQSHPILGQRYDWEAAAAWSHRSLHMPLRPNTWTMFAGSCNWAAANGVSVLLTGEGGDDWLSGSFAHFPDLLRAGDLRTLMSEGMSAGFGVTVPQRLRWTASSAIGPIVSRRRRARLLRPHLNFALDLPCWISPHWAQRIGLADRWRRPVHPPALASMAQKQRYAVYSLARRHMNIDNVLGYIASRRVELRHPFHDFRLTRFLMGAAGGVLNRGGVRKHLLREAMRGTLPELVRARRDKANMSVPVYDAIAQRLRERPIADMICVREGWLDGAAITATQAEHAAWRARGATGKPPASPYSQVWNAVAVDCWLEHAAGIR